MYIQNYKVITTYKNSIRLGCLGGMLGSLWGYVRLSSGYVGLSCGYVWLSCGYVGGYCKTKKRKQAQKTRKLRRRKEMRKKYLPMMLTMQRQRQIQKTLKSSKVTRMRPGIHL